MSRPLRAAIAGVGRAAGMWGADAAAPHLMGIGHVHARAYEQRGCEVVAGVARSPQSRRAFEAAFPGARGYASYGEMLRCAEPDLVSLCAYAGSRRAMVQEAARAGVRGIWAEKPLCLTGAEARAIRTACERSGTRLVVNHYRRHLDLFRVARELIASGAIGAVREVSAALEDWDLLEQGSHWLDLFRFLLGEPQAEWVMGQVACSGAKVRYGHVMEEQAVAVVGFAGGARGLLVAGPPTPESDAIRVSGTRGLLVLTSAGVRLIAEDGARRIATRSDLDDPLPQFADEDDPFGAVLDELLAWLGGGPEPAVGLRNATRSAELGFAAYESALCGGAVTPPLARQERFPLVQLANGTGAPLAVEA